MATRFLDELKGIINKRGGFAKPSHFYVDFSGLSDIGFDLAEARDLSNLVTKVNIPERKLKTIEFSPFRHSSLYPVGYENEELIIEFNVTTDMFIKKIFDKWTEKILPSDSYLMKYSSTTDKLKQFKIDLTIYQQAANHNISYKVKLDGVYPLVVPKIEMSDDAEGILRLSVNFSFNDISWDHIEASNE